jgi:putative membrane protein
VLRAILIQWALVAVAFALTAALLDGMTISGGVLDYLWLALLFGIVNALLGTIVRLITLPLTVLTLGLFGLVINALMLEVTDWLSHSLTIDHFFWTALWAALILSIAEAVLNLIVRPWPHPPG